MNAPVNQTWPPSPQPGQRWGGWTWNGSRWVCTRMVGVFTNVQVFNFSAPYTPTPGLTSLTAECWGGGAGGGTVGAAGSEALGGGGGGGSGGYSRKTLAASMVAGGVNVTIGAGGEGVTADLATGASVPGGPTSFGVFCVANGGQGGQANTSETYWGEPGGGGAPGLGDIAVPGNPGFPGSSLTLDGSNMNVNGGAGGVIMGGGAIGELIPGGNSAPGNPGTGPGAGGSGACVNTAPAAINQPGGNGAAGLCVVTETCWADTGDDGDCGCGPARVDWGPCPPTNRDWND